MTQNGTSLPELLLVLALVGIVGGITTPRIGDWSDRIAVESAQARLRGLLDQARAAAIRLDLPVALTDSAGALRLLAGEGPSRVEIRATPVPASITLSGLEREIRFGPHGMATSLANRTIRLQRGRIVRSLTLSRLGRIRS